jgi:ribose 5-phosphate isomerase B
MKIFFAGDHAGFELKGKLMEFVSSLGYEVEDLGPKNFNPRDDYVDFVIPLAKKVATSPIPTEVGTPSSRRDVDIRGIIVAGSGQGEIIAANRVRGARAALMCPGPQMEALIKASRDHNDSNIFCVGARFCTEEEAKAAVKLWLETPFSGDERHIKRLQKIDAS